MLHGQRGSESALAPMWGVFQPVLLDFRCVGVLGVLVYFFHDHGEMGAAAPPGGVLCESN